MKSRLSRALLIAALGFSMLELTGCATSSGSKREAQITKMQKARAKRMAQRDPVGSMRDYSLFRKGDINGRILRRGQKARYTNALDSL